jgi:hypothetical protein
MSDEERESLKAELVDHVRIDLKSFEKRKVSLTVGVAVSFLISFAYGVWMVRGGLDDVKSDLGNLKDGQNQIHKDLNYKISVNTFGNFAFRLQRDNPALKVPEVLQAPESPPAAAASDNAN